MMSFCAKLFGDLLPVLGLGIKAQDLLASQPRPILFAIGHAESVLEIEEMRLGNAERQSHSLPLAVKSIEIFKLSTGDMFPGLNLQLGRKQLFSQCLLALQKDSSIGVQQLGQRLQKPKARIGQSPGISLPATMTGFVKIVYHKLTERLQDKAASSQFQDPLAGAPVVPAAISVDQAAPIMRHQFGRSFPGLQRQRFARRQAMPDQVLDQPARADQQSFLGMFSVRENFTERSARFKSFKKFSKVRPVSRLQIDHEASVACSPPRRAFRVFVNAAISSQKAKPVGFRLGVNGLKERLIQGVGSFASHILETLAGNQLFNVELVP